MKKVIMLIKLKMLFCRHKFQRESFQFLGQTRDATGQTVIGLPIYANYNNFTEKHVCCKCGKVDLRKTKYMRKDHNCSVLR